MKRATIWHCDICGREIEGDYYAPVSWGHLDFLDVDNWGKQLTIDFCCRECAKKAVEKVSQVVNR